MSDLIDPIEFTAEMAFVTTFRAERSPSSLPDFDDLDFDPEDFVT